MNKAVQLESGLRSMESGTDVLNYHAPVIGISGNFREGDCTLAQAYYMSVLEAGGTPVVIPSYDDDKALVSVLDRLDGIVCRVEPILTLIIWAKSRWSVSPSTLVATGRNSRLFI